MPGIGGSLQARTNEFPAAVCLPVSVVPAAIGVVFASRTQLNHTALRVDSHVAAFDVDHEVCRLTRVRHRSAIFCRDNR
jgi:hypothetical protein